MPELPGILLTKSQRYRTLRDFSLLLPSDPQPACPSIRLQQEKNMIAKKCYPTKGTESEIITKEKDIIDKIFSLLITIALVEMSYLAWTSLVTTITSKKRKNIEFQMQGKELVNDIFICNIQNLQMGRIRQWIKKQISKTAFRPIWRLFLQGVRGQIENKNPKPYNFYLKIFSVIGSISVIYYLLLLRKNQMDIKGHNIFIPDYVYKVREESYIYWETVRLAKGMPTFLTYYKWDENLMFEIGRDGKQTPIQTHRNLQNVSTFQSPLHQYNFPASPQRHSYILMYLKNLNNPYDLFNYLRLKPINLGDWIRAGYYLVYRELGITNRWRYDEFVRKPDIYYRLEKLKLAFRISRDRKQLYNIIDELSKQVKWKDVLNYLIWIS